MSVTLADLNAKPFKIDIRGVEVTCQPLDVADAFSVSQVGEVFKDLPSASRQQIKDAAATMSDIIAERIPELKDTNLAVPDMILVITAMAESITPADNKELNSKGVKFDTDPKAEKIG